MRNSIKHNVSETRSVSALRWADWSVFYYLEFQTMDNVQKPRRSDYNASSLQTVIIAVKRKIRNKEFWASNGKVSTQRRRWRKFWKLVTPSPLSDCDVTWPYLRGRWHIQCQSSTCSYHCAVCEVAWSGTFYCTWPYNEQSCPDCVLLLHVSANITDRDHFRTEWAAPTSPSPHSDCT
jgi:hypothetical protein